MGSIDVELSENHRKEVVGRFKALVQGRLPTFRSILSEHSDILSQSREILGGETAIDERNLSDKELLREAVSEALVGPTNDILSVEYLDAGLIAKRPVGRIVMERTGGGNKQGVATGVLVAPGIVLTNWHVFKEASYDEILGFQLNYEENNLGMVMKSQTFYFNSEKFYFSDKNLDYALCAVEDYEGSIEKVNQFGYHVLPKRASTIKLGMPASMIHHPDGGFKSITVHNSNFVEVEQSEQSARCWYTADTRKGSSGSLVYDQGWSVIALHSEAVPETNGQGIPLDQNGNELSWAAVKSQNPKVSYIANEGIIAFEIYRHFKDANMVDANHIQIQKQLVNTWSKRGAWQLARAKTIEGMKREFSR